MLAACAQLRRPNEPVSVFNVRNEPTLYQFWMSIDTLNLLAQGRGAEALAEVLRAITSLSLHADPRWEAFLRKMGLAD
jgi:hypothetical protein